MSKRRFVLTALLSFACHEAFCEGPDTLPASCITEQTSYIHVQFSISGADPSGLRKKFNDDITEIQTVSSGIGVKKMNAGGLNYTIQAQSGGVPAIYDGPVGLGDTNRAAREEESPSISFQLSGNVNFLVEPASKALPLLNLLLQKQYPATLSMVDANKTVGQCSLNVSSRAWK